MTKMVYAYISILNHALRLPHAQAVAATIIQHESGHPFSLFQHKQVPFRVEDDASRIIQSLGDKPGLVTGGKRGSRVARL